CQAAEYMGGKPVVCSGHGADGLGDVAGLAAAEAFAAAGGDGKATPVLGPAGTVPPAKGELGEAAAAGLPGAFGCEPGEAPGAVAATELPGEGEPAEGGGLAAFTEATAPEETATPCGAGLALPVGEGLSSSFGARAPTLARSWPMRIFPSKTGRSKMKSRGA